jgi:hypothetical protein
MLVRMIAMSDDGPSPCDAAAEQVSASRRDSKVVYASIEALIRHAGARTIVKTDRVKGAAIRNAGSGIGVPESCRRSVGHLRRCDDKGWRWWLLQQTKGRFGTEEDEERARDHDDEVEISAQSPKSFGRRAFHLTPTVQP